MNELHSNERNIYVTHHIETDQLSAGYIITPKEDSKL